VRNKELPNRLRGAMLRQAGGEAGSRYDVYSSDKGLRDRFWIRRRATTRVDPQLTTKTNNSGGIQGGITNGAPIYFNVAFKPAATIGQAQTTVTYDQQDGVLEAKGRHDPCVVPRAVPIVESMASLVIMDAVLAQQARQGARSLLPPLKGVQPVNGTD
jgi:chorismate synthase